jgi:adenylate cyclase
MSGDTQPIAQWLIDGARSAPRPQDVLATLCAGLVASGIPLWRAAIFVRTLHPNVAGRRFEWRMGEAVAIAEMPYQALETPPFVGSPIPRVCASGQAMRCRREGPPKLSGFPALAPFLAEGITDYWVTPLLFSNDEVHVASWATREPSGFSDAQLTGIERILAPLARVAEIHALRRTAVNLLDAYVGHRSGERILAGAIRRGDTETIHAAIWLSDMRGFTALADRLPSGQLLALLNRYFDCQTAAIARHGGEVLKFIGDGLLAIFPVAGSETEVCAAALAAAKEASTAVAAIAATPAGEGVRFGLALHLGEVEYGNIGGERRLDFTCIGPAVNLAARLEKLTGKLGYTIVASSAFARLCPSPLRPVGEFNLAGFTRAEVAYALPIEERP